MNPAKLVSVVMLVTLTFGAGLEINRAHLVLLFKDTRLMLRAIAANFIVVPLLGVALANAFHLKAAIATGFLLMAIAPGVPLLITGARKKGGSLALAVTMALFFPLLSILTVPLTASIVLPSGERAFLPLGQFVATLLLFQFLPLLAGATIADRLPAIAAKLRRPAHLLFLISVVVLVAALAPRLARDVGLVYGSRAIWAMLCISPIAMCLGWLAGGPDERDRRTLSIGTALRNIGLCALVATVSFSGEPLVAATVLTYLVVQFAITAVTGLYFARTAAPRALGEPAS